MHPSDFIGKPVRVRSTHEEFSGRLQDVSDWGMAGGGNYLVLAVEQPNAQHRSHRVVAVAMRELELFEPLE